MTVFTFGIVTKHDFTILSHGEPKRTVNLTKGFYCIFFSYDCVAIHNPVHPFPVSKPSEVFFLVVDTFLNKHLDQPSVRGQRFTKFNVLWLISDMYSENDTKYLKGCNVYFSISEECFTINITYFTLYSSCISESTENLNFIFYLCIFHHPYTH